jgi:hypothetical protein
MASHERRLAALERLSAKAETNRENTVMSEANGDGNGRSTKGLFAPGNTIAKGNVGNARMKALRRALIDCVTPEKVEEVEATLYRLAVGGDVTASKTWLDHVIGRPVQAVELSGGDGQAPVMVVPVGSAPTRRTRKSIGGGGKRTTNIGPTSGGIASCWAGTRRRPSSISRAITRRWMRSSSPWRRTIEGPGMPTWGRRERRSGRGDGWTTRGRRIKLHSAALAESIASGGGRESWPRTTSIPESYASPSTAPIARGDWQPIVISQ